MEILWWLLGFGVVITVYALVEAQLFTVRRATIACLPPSCGPLTILHISDLHLTPSQGRKIRWLRKLDALNPDLVVATGDFIAHRLAIPALAEALAPLLARPGLFVLGSNDFHGPVLKNPLRYFDKNREIKPEGAELPTEELIALLTTSGWQSLENAQTQIEVKGLRIHARGTGDWHARKADYAKVAGPFPEDAFALGVTHSPYRGVLEPLAVDGAALLLAGHTHGGQICLPFFGALVTNCDLPRNQASGASEFRHGNKVAPLHISGGLGTSPITPIRLACRPSVTLLTLTASTGNT